MEHIDEDYFQHFDHYDYYMDNEYGTDDYYDVFPTHLAIGTSPPAGQKRKRVSAHDGKTKGKRRKTGPESHEGLTDGGDSQSGLPRIIWQSTSQTFDLKVGLRTVDGDKLYALFPDWKERFKKARGFTTKLERYNDKEHVSTNLDEAEEGDEEEDELLEDDEQEADDGDPGIDPELLMSALHSKLASSGLKGVDQEAFMQSMMKMISGGSVDMEEMLGQLTTSLLEQASEEGTDSTTAQWLSQQGVSLDAEDDDEIKSVNGAEDESTAKDGDTSPRDSAVSVHQQSGPTCDGDVSKPHPLATESTEQALAKTAVSDQTSPSTTGEGPSPASKPSSDGAKDSNEIVTEAIKAPRIEETAPKKADSGSLHLRKRKAAREEEDVPAGPPKRRLRSFAAPTASSSSKAAGPATKSTRASKPKK